MTSQEAARRYAAARLFRPIDKEAWDSIYEALTEGLRREPVRHDPDLFNNGFMRLDNVMTYIMELANGHRNRDISAIMSAIEAINNELIRYFKYSWIYTSVVQQASGPSAPSAVPVIMARSLHEDSTPLQLVRVVAAFCWEFEHQCGHNGPNRIRELKCVEIVCMLRNLLQGLYLENHTEHAYYMPPSFLSYKNMAVGNVSKDCPMSISCRAIELMQQETPSTMPNDQLSPRYGGPNILNRAAPLLLGVMTSLGEARAEASSKTRRATLGLQLDPRESASESALQGPSRTDYSKVEGMNSDVRDAEGDWQDEETVPPPRTRPVATATTFAAVSPQGSTRRVSVQTAAQHEKGKLINEEGVEADDPCARCKANESICKVPLDPRRPDPRHPDADSPKRMNTFKCGNCLADKQGCSFSAYNPGIQYPEKMLLDYTHAGRPRKDGGSGKNARGRKSNTGK